MNTIVRTIVPMLPPELTDNIIDNLRHDSNTLKTCAIVCRSWCPRSRVHLFTHIRHHAWFHGDPEELYQFLRNNPNIAQRVFFFSLNLFSRQIEIYNEGGPMIERLLGILPSLHVIEIVGIHLPHISLPRLDVVELDPDSSDSSDEDDAEEIFEEVEPTPWSRSILKLRVEGCRGDNVRDLFHFLNHFPSVEDVELVEVDLERHGPRILPPSHMPQLEAFSMFPTNFSGIQGQFLRRVCSVRPMKQLKFEGAEGGINSIAKIGQLLCTQIGSFRIGSSLQILYIDVPELPDDDWGLTGNLAQYHHAVLQLWQMLGLGVCKALTEITISLPLCAPTDISRPSHNWDWISLQAILWLLSSPMVEVVTISGSMPAPAENVISGSMPSPAEIVLFCMRNADWTRISLLLRRLPRLKEVAFEFSVDTPDMATEIMDIVKQGLTSFADELSFEFTSRRTDNTLQVQAYGPHGHYWST